VSKKILFIVPHRINRCPGQRFRFEQYISTLQNNGYETTFSPLLNEDDDKIFYSKGKYVHKFYILLKSIMIRLSDLFSINQYDIVFIYREAIMIGSTFFERLYSFSKAKIIFDYDDSIWLNDTSDGNKNLSWLKKPSKTKKIIKRSDLVIVGNKYLYDYASKYNKNVEIVPTTINTEYHKKNLCKIDNSRICIGWTGTSTTLKHFQTLEPVLEKIKEEFEDKVYFKLICNTEYENKKLELKSTQWKLNTEIDDLSEIDIGIMPLPNDKWAKGKCGFKGLQYMSLEIPTIMSPVGVNTEIIDDGKNGFLADSETEWYSKLSVLITSSELRNRLGKNGRYTVEKYYSTDATKDRYLKLFDDIIL
jgi:glycosyltransferase involved in cell wall biosynthesis